MKLKVGDLVQWKKEPSVLGIVTLVHRTGREAPVCEVLVVSSEILPTMVGEKKYFNQDYWKKLG